MAKTEKLDINGSGLRMIPISFAPNNTSAPSSDGYKGTQLASVERTGTGEFTITLKDTFPFGYVYVSATPQVSSTADVMTLIGDVDLTTGKTIKLHVRNGSAAADIAANANNRINILLIVKTRSTSA